MLIGVSVAIGVALIAAIVVLLMRVLRRAAGDGYCCGVAGLAAKSVEAFDDTQLNRLRDSMNRPAFDRAPKTTTATFCPVSGRRSTVARQ